ncbi:MAG TPA: hypothetical protein VLK84_31840 [Longimicrobium sp.]|nr:hypothetical protein [Longimicrobium sp.]
MRYVLPALALLLLAACGDSPTRPPSGPPGITFVTSQTTSDTIRAIVPLVVEVRDADGQLQAGASVLFEAGGSLRLGLVGDPDNYARQATVLTGPDGRAQVQVRLGTTLQEADVTVAVTGQQTVTARFRVLPGAPFLLVATPGDSMVYPGSEYPVTGAARDLWGHMVPAAVTFTAGNAHVSVANGVVRAESVGRGFLIARSGNAVDTLWVSVVPRGVLAARPGLGPDAGTLVVFNTDGSGYRVLREGTGADAPRIRGVFPTWNGDGSELVYLSGSRIMATDAAGAVRVVWDGTAAPLDPEQPPQVSSDGWIYFGVGPNARAARTFWRVRTDGTGAGPVSAEVQGRIDTHPSPSATGDAVVYQTNRLTSSTNNMSLRVVSTATGVVRALDVPGITPRWSPTGEWIAYRVSAFDNRLRVMRSDGTGIRPVGAELGAYPVFSWSRDGVWLAISDNQPTGQGSVMDGVSLVNVATGERLPLRMPAQDMGQPAWKP